MSRKNWPEITIYTDINTKIIEFFEYKVKNKTALFGTFNDYDEYLRMKNPEMIMGDVCYLRSTKLINKDTGERAGVMVKCSPITPLNGMNGDAIFARYDNYGWGLAPGETVSLPDFMLRKKMTFWNSRVAFLYMPILNIIDKRADTTDEGNIHEWITCNKRTYDLLDFKEAPDILRIKDDDGRLIRV